MLNTKQPTIVTANNQYATIGIVALIGLVGYWTYELIKPYPAGHTPWIFLDYLNLLIHEAGHLIFSPFGQFTQAIGGSVAQVAMPSLFFGYFYYTKQLIGSAFCLFWVGNNLINVSYYIGDANDRLLPLLGGDGVIHDWQWILTELGWIAGADILAAVVKILGVLLLLSSIALLVLIILQQKSPSKRTVS